MAAAGLLLRLGATHFRIVTGMQLRAEEEPPSGPKLLVHRIDYGRPTRKKEKESPPYEAGPCSLCAQFELKIDKMAGGLEKLLIECEPPQDFNENSPKTFMVVRNEL